MSTIKTLTDEQLRDRMAMGPFQDIKNKDAQRCFKAGWDAARANDPEKEQLKEDVFQARKKANEFIEENSRLRNQIEFQAKAREEYTELRQAVVQMKAALEFYSELSEYTYREVGLDKIEKLIAHPETHHVALEVLTKCAPSFQRLGD